MITVVIQNKYNNSREIEQEEDMMPLSMVNVGEEQCIQRVTGRDETRKFLENLGFVEGSNVTVISQNSGNLIVNIKDTRVAIDRSMANRIMV